MDQGIQALIAMLLKLADFIKPLGESLKVLFDGYNAAAVLGEKFGLAAFNFSDDDQGILQIFNGFFEVRHGRVLMGTNCVRLP